jgi:hypothetical protein
VDRHFFYADSDQDPTFHFEPIHIWHQNNADPQADPAQSSQVGKLGKFFVYFYSQ